MRKKILSLVVMAVASFLPAFVQAGGLSLYEIATSDVGLAGAGWAARAQDPSTLLKNPAGMSLLEGNQFQGGAQLLHASIGFSPGAGTSVSGNDGGNPVGTLPAMSLFYVHGLGQDVKVGLGLFSNFGMAMNYDAGCLFVRVVREFPDRYVNVFQVGLIRGSPAKGWGVRS